MSSTDINFTREMLEKLKRAYQHAVDSKQEIFTFEGREVLTSYAKHLIVYLEGIFGKIKHKGRWN